MLRVPHITNQTWSLEVLHDLIKHFCPEGTRLSKSKKKCIRRLNTQSAERGAEVFDSLSWNTMVVVFLPSTVDPLTRVSKLRAQLKTYYTPEATLRKRPRGSDQFSSQPNKHRAVEGADGPRHLSDVNEPSTPTPPDKTVEEEIDALPIGRKLKRRIKATLKQERQATQAAREEERKAIAEVSALRGFATLFEFTQRDLQTISLTASSRGSNAGTIPSKGEKRVRYDIIEEPIDNWELPTTTPTDDHKIQQILKNVAWVTALRKTLAILKNYTTRDKEKGTPEPVSKLCCHMILAVIVENGFLSSNQSWRPEPFKTTENKLGLTFEKLFPNLKVATKGGTPGSEDTLGRIPDSAFFSNQPGVVEHRYRCVQRQTTLPCEWKKAFFVNDRGTPLDPFYKAISEVNQDYALSLRFGWGPAYGVVSDGKNWYFLKTALLNTTGKVEFSTVRSELFPLLEGDLIENLKALLKAFIRIARFSFETEHLQYLDLGEQEFSILNYRFKSLVNVNGHSVVARYMDPEEQMVVFKIDTALPHRKDQSCRLMHEIAIVDELQNRLRNVVRKLPTTDLEDLGVLSMEDGGQCLEKLCLCCAITNKKIKDAVKRDIGDALDSFHEVGMAFVDLHPGNILLKEVGGEWKAKLVDFESVRPLNQDWKDSAGCNYCHFTSEMLAPFRTAQQKRFCHNQQLNADQRHRCSQLSKSSRLD